MFYQNVLSLLNWLLPVPVTLFILALLTGLYIYSGRNVEFDFSNFAPIALILAMHLLEKLLYFCFLIEIKDANTFFVICLIAGIICFLFKKFGAWVIIPLISIPILTFAARYLPVWLRYFILIAIALIAGYKIVKSSTANKWLCWLIATINFVSISLSFNMLNAAEVVLFEISLLNSVKRIYYNDDEDDGDDSNDDGDDGDVDGDEDNGIKHIMETYKPAFLEWARHLLLGFICFYFINLIFANTMLAFIVYCIYKFVKQII